MMSSCAGAGQYGGTYQTGGKTIATVKSYGVDARPTQVSPRDTASGSQGGKCIKRMIELGLFNDDSDFEDLDVNNEVEGEVQRSSSHGGSTEDFIAQYLQSHPSFLLKFLSKAITHKTDASADSVLGRPVTFNDKAVGLVSTCDFGFGPDFANYSSDDKQGSQCGGSTGSDDEEYDGSEYADDYENKRYDLRETLMKREELLRRLCRSASLVRKQGPSMVGRKSPQKTIASKARHNSSAQRQPPAPRNREETRLRSALKTGASKRKTKSRHKVNSSISSRVASAPGPGKGTSHGRPADNKDLTPFIKPDPKLTTSIDHSQTNPTQSVRQHVPYPAPAWIRDASEEMYWKNLEAADQKVVARRASVNSTTDEEGAKNGREANVTIPWTIFEDDLVIGHMLDIRIDATVPETEARFGEVSKRLLSQNNIYRTKTSIKNMWNRVGRARSGFDERRRQGGMAATSMQGNMVKKMMKEAKNMTTNGSAARKRKRYDEDSEEEMELEALATRVSDIDPASRAWMISVRNRKARKEN